MIMIIHIHVNWRVIGQVPDSGWGNQILCNSRNCKLYNPFYGLNTLSLSKKLT